MNVTVEKKEGLDVAITVELPLERLEALKEKKFSTFAKEAKVKGFRPGKAPRWVLERRYGSAVLKEVQHELIKSSFKEAVEQEKLTLGGHPQFGSEPSMTGDSFIYSATVELFPEIVLKKLEGVELEKISAEVTEEDVETALKGLAERHAQWEPVSREAKTGDRLEIDFEGFMDGVAFEGGKATNHKLDLGSGEMIPGFEAGLEKVKAGDEIDLEVTFPESYGAEDLAGKPAVFKVKVHQVYEHQIPPIDEAFLELLEIENSSVEKLREEIRSSLRRELAFTVRSRFVKTVLEAVLEANPFPVPKALVAEEVERIYRPVLEAFAMYGRDQAPLKQALAESMSEWESKAERKVRLSLLVKHALDEFGLEADPKRVEELIALRASAYDDPEEVVASYCDDPDKLEEIEWLVLEEMLAEAFAKDATIKEVKKTLQEALKSEEESIDQ